MKILFVLVGILLFSCNKYGSCENCDFQNATVLYTGPVQSDGCDWAIKIDATEVFYHPDVLHDTLKQDQLKIKIRFRDTPDRFICGIASIGMPVIHVLEIRK